MKTPQIKICGITKAAETAYLNEAKVDYAGFVFFEKSKRNITPEDAKEIFKLLDKNIKKVAVTVSPDVESIRRIEEAGFDIVQIHKNMSKEVLEACKLPIWFAINIENDEEASKKLKTIEELPKELSQKIEGYVVDAPNFGSGQTFDWKKSKRLKQAGCQSPPESTRKRKFILAGGLNPSNVSEGIEIFEPDIIDVSSGVEIQIGQKPDGAPEYGKSNELISNFVKAVRTC